MYKLLVVDDDYESRTTLCNCFPWSDVGFEVSAQFSNGKEALDYVKSNSVDVILCDIKMPIMSGIELVQALHSHTYKPIIVFLSGYRDFSYAQNAIAYGVRYYIVKPARYQELVDCFQQIKNELELKASVSKSSENTDTPSDANETVKDKQIEMIKAYIDEHYQNVKLEDISKYVYMNPSYLSQFFKSKTGINFTDYLIEVKMKKAAMLLKDVSLRTYDISEMVGYTNAKNFARSFKNYYNMTPTEYRNKHFSQN